MYNLLRELGQDKVVELFMFTASADLVFPVVHYLLVTALLQRLSGTNELWTHVTWLAVASDWLESFSTIVIIKNLPHHVPGVVQTRNISAMANVFTFGLSALLVVVFALKKLCCFCSRN